MKHLIVVAHPVEDSFTMGLTHAYIAELERLGHSHQTYDLYGMGFNPILAAHELLPVTADDPASVDIVRAQDDIRALFPCADFAMLTSAGHWLHAEDPAGFLAAILPFLDAESQL